MACSIAACIIGHFRDYRGGPDITPETHPLFFWATVIGTGLFGLAATLPWLISFFRDRRHE